MQQALSDAATTAALEKKTALDRLQAECDTAIAEAVAQREECMVLYTQEAKKRRALHNKLMDLMGNIRVICRIRPVLPVDCKTGTTALFLVGTPIQLHSPPHPTLGQDQVITHFPSEEELLLQRDDSTKNRFEFDRVFDLVSTQEQVFDAVQPMIVSCLDGYKVCIFGM